MKKMKLLLLCLVAGVMGAKAQIGYQISLLNTATGEPRANETVTVSVSLSNNANEVFYTETKSATTNDFGVLSLSIGNAETFKEVDLSKMPFFIEVTANGVMIGKSQMLNVPVSEVAKRVAPMDKSLIVGTWIDENGTYTSEYSSSVHAYTFYSDGTVIEYDKYVYSSGNIHENTYNGVYEIEGNYVLSFIKGGKDTSDTMKLKMNRYYNGELLPVTNYASKLIKQ